MEKTVGKQKLGMGKRTEADNCEHYVGGHPLRQNLLKNKYLGFVYFPTHICTYI